MVAGSNYVIFDIVHDLGDVFALGQSADRAALNGITGVNDEICALSQFNEFGIILVIGAVHVVRVQDHDVP